MDVMFFVGGECLEQSVVVMASEKPRVALVHGERFLTVIFLDCAWNE